MKRRRLEGDGLRPFLQALSEEDELAWWARLAAPDRRGMGCLACACLPLTRAQRT